jgi:hypothetical protein
VPPGRAELPGAHDLRTDPDRVLPSDRIVDAGRAAGLVEHLTAGPSGRDHPLVEPMAGMTERCIDRLTLASTEAIERNGEVVNSGKGHRRWSSPGSWGSISLVRA